MRPPKSDRDKIKFLSKPKNIDIAFEVHRKFPDVRKRLQEKFWSQIRAMIEEEVRESPAKFDGWVCSPKEKQEDDDYFDVGLMPLNMNGTSYCYLNLGQKRL